MPSTRLHVLVSVLVLCVLGIWSPPAYGYAWLIRHGYAQCANCHTDPSGGEGLTQMGRVQAETLLSQSWSGAADVSPATRLGYALAEPDWLRAGGSLRAISIVKLPAKGEPASVVAFPMQMDAYATLALGQWRGAVSLGYARIPQNSPHLRGAQIFQRESGPNLLSRSHWLGWAFDWRWLLRVGRINLPYGLRSSEHVMWVREATKTDRESDQQHGAALSYSSPRLRAEAMAVAGNFQLQPDRVRERGYVTFVEFRPAVNWAVGVSSQVLRSAQSISAGRSEPTTRQAHGAMLRWALRKPIVLLAEGNLLASSGRELGHVEALTLDYEPVQGVHLVLTEEILDAGAEPKGPARPQTGKAATGTWFGVQWFVATHWDLRLDLVKRYDVPPSLQLQAHFYL